MNTQNTNEKYIIVAVIGVNNIILGNQAPENFPKIPTKDILYDTGVNNLVNTTQWIKKDVEQIKIIGVFKITKEPKPRKIYTEFINKTDKILEIYLNPLTRNSPIDTTYLNMKKCKHYVTLSPVGSVSSHQIIKDKVAGDLICGWYDRNWIFNKYRLIGAVERHITVNGDEQFYIN